jgi:hypothetical protein
MSGVSPSLNTNPNAMGGSFNYDSRTGLGYGKTSNGGLGSDWSMGDALSSPKGEWDNDLPINNPGKEIAIGPDTTVEELAIAAGIIEKEDESISGIEAGINSKANTSLHMPTVDFHAKNKRNPNSYVGLSNTSAYLGASHKRSGYVMLEDYIREVILEKTSIGARSSLKSTIGDPYKPGPHNVSNTSRGLGHKSNINRGYNGNSTQGVDVRHLEPYVSSPKLKATKDGHNLTGYPYGDKSYEEENWDNERSSAEIMTDIFDEEKEAEIYVNRY